MLDNSGQVVIDPDGGFDLIKTSTDFLITFDKPIIPESLGQSITFGSKAFNGNTRPMPSSLIYNPPPPNKNPCANGGTYVDPIAPNVTLAVQLLYDDGTPQGPEVVLPFRCHPLHQNNLCTYLLDPLVDLPSSSELGSPPFKDPSVTGINRMRITARVYRHDENFSFVNYQPVNMGPAGFFGETVEQTREVTFTANCGKPLRERPGLSQCALLRHGHRRPGGCGPGRERFHHQ